MRSTTDIELAWFVSFRATSSVDGKTTKIANTHQGIVNQTVSKWEVTILSWIEEFIVDEMDSRNGSKNAQTSIHDRLHGEILRCVNKIL